MTNVAIPIGISGSGKLKILQNGYFREFAPITDEDEIHFCLKQGQNCFLNLKSLQDIDHWNYLFDKENVTVHLVFFTNSFHINLCMRMSRLSEEDITPEYERFMEIMDEAISYKFPKNCKTYVFDDDVLKPADIQKLLTDR